MAVSRIAKAKAMAPRRPGEHPIKTQTKAAVISAFLKQKIILFEKKKQQNNNTKIKSNFICLGGGDLGAEGESLCAAASAHQGTD